MRQIIVNLYSFDELSEEAQRRAWMNYAENISDFGWSEDYRATLEAFENAFDVTVSNWHVDENGFGFKFYHHRENETFEWIRFAAWVWNNYGDKILTGKYYGKISNGRHIKRYSRATVEHTCSLTGFCADLDIMAPMIRCIHYKEAFFTYDQLIGACLESFFEAWRADMEYQTSLEAFEERCTANEWEFYESGEMA